MQGRIGIPNLERSRSGGAALRHDRLQLAVAAAFLVAAAMLALTHLWIPGLSSPVLGSDLIAYEKAAERLVATGNPYAQALVDGPIENRFENVPIGYFYTPVLAQIFAFGGWTARDLAGAWTLAQIASMTVLLPLVYRTYAGRLTPTSTLAVLGLALSSHALNFGIFIGNVSGWIAIGVAAMLIERRHAAGMTGALLAVLKPTAAPLALVAIVHRPTRRAALVSAAAMVAVSMVLAPDAWGWFVRVIPNILQLTMSDWASNWSAPALLGGWGLAGVGRLLGYAIAGGMTILALWWARQDGEFGRSVAAATVAATFASATVWEHYLAVFVPLTIAAWPGARPVRRGMLVVGMAWLALPWFDDMSNPMLRAATLIVLGAYVIGILIEPIAPRRAGDPTRTLASSPAPA